MIQNEQFSRQVTGPVNLEDPAYIKLKATAEAVVKELDTKLGREATLQDFIADLISQYTHKEIEDKYNGLVQAFSLTGRDVSQADSVYKSMFKVGDMFLEKVENILSKEGADSEKTTKNENLITEFDKSNNENLCYKPIEKTDNTQQIKKKKERDFSDFLPWIWGGIALFSILIGVVIKFPYLSAIVITLVLVNFLIKKNNE